MIEEIFDVVNERDEVIGQEIRREVHRLALKHRAVHVLIFNPKGQLFLQKRSMAKDNFPGAWDSSASGHLDSGEGYDDCALREIKEELGVVLTRPPERMFKVDACIETGQEFAWVYRGFWDGAFVLQAEEIETGAWFGFSEIDEWISRGRNDFASGFLLIWERFRASYSDYSNVRQRNS